MKRLTTVAGVFVCASLVYGGTASADVITHWNDHARTFAAANRPGAGPSIIIDIAMVQAAMHDAVQAYDRRFEAYAVTLSATLGSPVVAAARAARDVLIARFPAPAQVNAIHAAYETYLTSQSLLPTDAGADTGAAAALAIVQQRAALHGGLGDGSFPSSFPPFEGDASVPGMWRKNANTPGMVAPWLGAVVPYLIPSTPFGEPDAIPALTSAEYAEAYNEVKALGALTGSSRSDAQTRLARFFTDDFLSQFARVLADAAARHLTTSGLQLLGDRARLFALGHMATADSLICAWKAKTDFAFWRPEHAIRDGNLDRNMLTDGDAAWTPFVATPNYPDYTSGANNVAAAMTRILALFFGSDHLPVSVTTVSPRAILAGDATTRNYKRFSDISKDVVDVRIYQGIHFRFADTEARSQARRVAGYAFGNFLRPLD
jgi:hypothetical protein